MKPYQSVQKMATSPTASTKTTEANALLPANNVVIEDAPLQDDALVSENDSDSLPLATATLSSCVVTSAYTSSVTTTTAASLSGIEPVSDSVCTHISTSMISDALLPTSESTDTNTELSIDPDVQFLGSVASQQSSFIERRNEHSQRFMGKTHFTAYVGKVRFDAKMAGAMLSDVSE